MKRIDEIYLNIGLVIRGDVLRLKELMRYIQDEFSDLKIIYQKTSTNKLLIEKEKEDDNDNNSDSYFHTG